MAEKSYSSKELQLVAFQLGREEYGINILQVQEIKRMTDITRVPHTPDYLKGVMNLRGSILPVFDLKKRLDLPHYEYSDDARIIIVKSDEVTLGVIVDAVSEVLTIGQENIEPPQAVAGGVIASYLSGIGKINDRLLILLDINSIIGAGQDTVK